MATQNCDDTFNDITVVCRGADIIADNAGNLTIEFFELNLHNLFEQLTPDQIAHALREQEQYNQVRDILNAEEIAA